MDNQDDPWRAKEETIAKLMLRTAKHVDELIKGAAEDVDLTFYIGTCQWLRDRANVFDPPGPSESKRVVNLESYKSRLPPDRPRTRG